MTWERLVLSVIALIALGWAGVARADYRLTCASIDDRYERCRLSEPGRVELARQLSKSSCRLGRTWGYTRHDVWVSDGCRAEFRVDTYGYRPGGHGYNNNDRHDNKDAKVAGAVVGALLLGAIIANQKDKESSHDNGRYAAPDWMVGRFAGYNPRFDAEIDMTISRDGRVTAHTQGSTMTGWVDGDRMKVQGAEFRIERIRDGFVTSQVGNERNEVVYHRE
ncbi:MAG: DUF3011 domain-containing protein [Rhodanobacteraceae bacterium]|nr:DUF3011 domain-containing protein [Xanthomonadales bacterium]MCP5479225.1 DUF3011 domain-containing protein [Rhodanobacteraceae bacterium]HPF73152.1 DUF3011 domain-containing protein [Xanthomonadaceae bacterium]HRX99704.1 DUF3011 domain-containing protein [Xanthomonadaceae bacterium]